jgi:hypothetical protein
MGCGGFRTQDQNASDNLADILIEGDQSFGIKLTERDVQRPLVLPQRAEAVQSEMDTFSDADSGGPSEQ